MRESRPCANWVTPWLNNATLTSITSVRKYTLQAASDLDFTAADLAIHDSSAPTTPPALQYVHVQELHMSGSSDRVDWVTGLYFDNVRAQRNEAITLEPQYEGFLSTLLISGDVAALPTGLISTANPQNFFSEITGAPYGATYTGVAQQDQWNQSSNSSAAFGNATWHVTDEPSLTWRRALHARREEHRLLLPQSEWRAGLRRSDHHQRRGPGTGRARRAGVGDPPADTHRGGQHVPALGKSAVQWPRRRRTSSARMNWSGSFKAAYRWDESVMTYLSAERGHKAGGFNLAREQSSDGTTSGGSGIIPVTDTQFPGESVTSFELGAKTTWADGNLLLNAALFHSKYTDYQLNLFSGISWVVDSVPQLTTQGVNLDRLWKTQRFRA